MVTIDDARAVASPLPRSYEVFVRGRVKFRVGQIVYLAFSKDETLMGFAFPKEWRQALVETEPDKFMLPSSGSSSWTRRRCGTSSSTPGRWSCRRRSPRRTPRAIRLAFSR